MKKDIIFYSNFCTYCKEIINQISKTPINDNILYVCVDDENIQLPNFIKAVPTIYLVSQKTAHRIVGYFEEEAVFSYTEYLNELEEIIKNNDDNFDSLSDEDEELITKSIDLIRNTNKASTSFLQRNFQIGYNKAARIMEALEQRGIVSSPNHAGKRDILIN